MDIYYNAFISYRHHPADIKVAEQIHRSLEHYRIPKALRKQGKKITRLFRDKEELPITSNLSDDITRALANSDFLIVICSTHTKESLWVQREIETFLKTHDHSRVLTVLVDGEPYDTIPEILCSEERVNPETGEVQLLPIEPLSCDWRVGHRKAMREELPRLAAALLGCGYDELRQRERQYRTQRMVAIGSVALAASLSLTGYVIYNSLQIQKANDQLTEANGKIQKANEQLTDANIQIQNNLEEAQINQSQYLASASQQQLEGGDRLLAMSLALAGLPEAEERPYVASAELALSQAVGTYQATSEAKAVGAIACDALINHFLATEERDYMFVADQRYVLSIWSLETMARVASVQMTAGSSDMAVTADQNVLIHCTDKSLYCYDKAGQLLWQAQDCIDMGMSQDMKSVLVTRSGNLLAVLDAATGQELDTMQLPTQEGELTVYFSLIKQPTYDLSKPFLLEASVDFDTALYAVDMQTETAVLVDILAEDDLVGLTGVAPDGNLLCTYYGSDSWYNGRFGQMFTHSPANAYLRCYSMEKAGIVWQTSLTSYTYCDMRTIETIPGTQNILWQVNNQFAVVDSATGQVLQSCEMGENPIIVEVEDTYAMAVLTDGRAGTYEYEKNEFNSSRYLKDQLVQGFLGKGFYVNQELSQQILIYKFIQDENWEQLPGNYDTYQDAQIRGERLILDGYNDISLVDLKTGKNLWTLPDPETAQYHLLDVSDDGSTLWLQVSDDTIVQVDTATQEQTVFALPERTLEDEPIYFNYYDRIFRRGETFLALGTDLYTEQPMIVVLDTAQDSWETFDVCTSAPEGTAGNSILLAVWEDTAYVWEPESGALYQVDLLAETESLVHEGLTEQPSVQFLNDRGVRMVAAGEEVTVLDAQGAELLHIAVQDERGLSACLMEDTFWLLTDSGTVYTYTLQGEQLGYTSASIYHSFYSDISSHFYPDQVQWIPIGQEDMFVNIFDMGNVLHRESGQKRAAVPYCIGYIPEQDAFLTQQVQEALMGKYKRYDLEMVKQMARDALGDYQLTQEQKTGYGLGE